MFCRLLDSLEKKGVIRWEPRTAKEDSHLQPPVESHVVIDWDIPLEASGTFRIVYHGDHMNTAGEVVAFEGHSREFDVLQI